MKPFSFSSTYCVFVFSLFVSCSLHGQPKPNIVWIVCEDISPYVGAYGDSIARTPNIDALAKEGMLFTKVYTTAGVCAPSRSSIITGMHQISIGTMHMRTSSARLPEISGGYAAVLPDYVKPFPHYLREVGYYTTNNAKKDYQFADPVTVWDESSIAAGYQNRSSGQPFFAVYNFAATHESQVIVPPDSLYYDPSQMPLPQFYQDAPQIRHDMAALYTRIAQMDADVGQLIAQLKNDGVYDQSYVIFYSDHGGNLPWTKREILERGTHIPFIVKFPHGRHSGTVNHDLISAVDFAPTTLSLAGISIPKHLQGKAFLGTQAAPQKNTYVFAARDRMDEHPERVRAVFDGRFRYIFNFFPELPKYQDLAYRSRMGSMQEILELRTQGKVTNPHLLDWFQIPKPQEELYHLAKDPDEIQNLVNDPAFSVKKAELKKALFDWMDRVGDLGATPESEMVNYWWQGQSTPPKTPASQMITHPDGVEIINPELGVFIGYRIFDKTPKEDSLITRKIKTWDFASLRPRRNRNTIKVPVPWQIYSGGVIPMKTGQTLQVRAQRIGYRPHQQAYVFDQ